MYDEEDFAQLSALQHLIFCERQCYLIHCEMIWQDNRFTAEGNIMHERADNQELVTYQTNVRVERAVLIKSSLLGLAGKADVVEFHHQENGEWFPYPVEYKRGKPKIDECDKIQLCAQAICLEEMMHCTITEGALFYGKTMHRHTVPFDIELRTNTINACQRLHQLLDSNNKRGTESVPPAIYIKEKCDTCSLKEQCLPQVLSSNFHSASKYIDTVISECSLSIQQEKP